MTCYFHEQTEAAGLCTHCGKAVCKQCLVEVDEMLLCKNCVATRRRRLPGRLHLLPVPPEKPVAALFANSIFSPKAAMSKGPPTPLFSSNFSKMLAKKCLCKSVIKLPLGAGISLH
jgi:hypothetical protein